MKILLVDDDPTILDTVMVGIQLQWPDADVLTASDGDAALRQFDEQNPDVVLLDVMMPGRSGFEVLREIRLTSDVPVVMLTARGQEVDQVRGLELGADDYVAKPFGLLALLARIKAVLRRAELPPPEYALPDFVAGDVTINFQKQLVVRGGTTVALTAIEYKVLYHLARNAGRLMPHEALLERVWGADSLATTDNLKVMISRLRRKLEVDHGPPLIETVRGVGYRLSRPRPTEEAGRG